MVNIINIIFTIKYNRIIFITYLSVSNIWQGIESTMLVNIIIFS